VALSPAVMGIVNVTPDSFFPASRTLAADEAIARGRAHYALGADIVDVGGESTRPHAESVAEDEELRRVLPVVRGLVPFGPVSIDTQKESVARAAVAAGATVLNDVSASLARVAGELGVGYIAMHRRGDAHTMQDNPTYTNVVAEISEFLSRVADEARGAGVGQLWLDPGIGFGKTVEHNVALLAHCDRFVALAASYDAGVVIGTSRKSFLGHLGRDSATVDDRLEASLATEAWAMVQGVSMVRVHDVRETVQLRDLLTLTPESVTP
jgi:dihydropteroate synthase